MGTHSTCYTSIVCSTEVITPGLSDHSIITAEVKYGSFVHQDEHIADRREIRFHSKADDIKFRKLMSDTYDKLVQMSSVQNMWDHFSKDFRYAIDASVPTETVKVRRDSQPPWSDRQVIKLYKKLQKLYKKYKETRNPYYSKMHRQQKKTQKHYTGRLKRSTSLTKYANHLKREIVSPSSSISDRNRIVNTHWLPSNYMMVL